MTTLIQLIVRHLTGYGGWHEDPDCDGTVIAGPACGWNLATITDDADEQTVTMTYAGKEETLSNTDPQLFCKIQRWARKTAKKVERDNKTTRSGR